MGTGKTLTTIAVAGIMAQKSLVHHMLIVAPLSIVGVWQNEFERFAAFDYSLNILEGPSARKIDAIRRMDGPALQVLVVNYESAWRLEKELLKWDADLIVADEGHKIKTHSTSAAKAMHRMGARARYRLLLTGTVITNKAIDVFSQYKYLAPEVFGPSFYAFRNRFFDMTGYGNYTPVLRRNTEPEFTQRLHSIAFRATKAECLDLPAATDIIQRIELEPSALAIYRALARDSFAELNAGTVSATNVLTRLLRLSQLTGGFLGDDEGNGVAPVSAAKLNALEDIIESAAQEGQKLVIIARFLPELKAISDLLTHKGLSFARISGETVNRAEEIERFQTDPSVTVFLGQIATAGLGITLTAASTMVFYSLDYSMSNYEQTKARIHRAGQRIPCTYFHLTVRGTVDELVLKALREKADLAKALVDDCRQGRNPFAYAGG